MTVKLFDGLTLYLPVYSVCMSYHINSDMRKSEIERGGAEYQ